MVTGPEVAHTVKLDKMTLFIPGVKTDATVTTLTPFMVSSGTTILIFSVFFHSQTETFLVEISRLCLFVFVFFFF